MRIGTTQPVRTQIQPGELSRFGQPARTTLNEGDLRRYQPASGELGAGDLSPYLRGARSGTAAQTDRHQQLTDTAQRWIGQTFFGTLLRQMRNSPFKSDLFSGGRGGEAFGAMFDQHLAERMAHSSGRRLAASIVNRIERSTARHTSKSAPAGAQQDPASGSMLIERGG